MAELTPVRNVTVGESTSLYLASGCGAGPRWVLRKERENLWRRRGLRPDDFHEACRWIIQRHGIFNPCAARGTIPGLLPHGPHNVRDVFATHFLKQTGSYEQASYAIQDTSDMVAQHYGGFLPHDRAAIKCSTVSGRLS